MKLPTHDIPGHETIYVECECGEDKRQNLFKRLRKSTSDAVNVQFHDEGMCNNIMNKDTLPVRVYSGYSTEWHFHNNKLTH